MKTDYDVVMVNLIPSEKPGVKLHYLIKAPENTQWALEKKNSWDASKPATVYVTPELTKEGTPCKAATVILRTKVAIGGGVLDVLFVDILMIQETM